MHRRSKSQVTGPLIVVGATSSVGKRVGVLIGASDKSPEAASGACRGTTQRAPRLINDWRHHPIPASACAGGRRSTCPSVLRTRAKAEEVQPESRKAGARRDRQVLPTAWHEQTFRGN